MDIVALLTCFYFFLILTVFYTGFELCPSGLTSFGQPAFYVYFFENLYLVPPLHTILIKPSTPNHNATLNLQECCASTIPIQIRHNGTFIRFTIPNFIGSLHPSEDCLPITPLVAIKCYAAPIGMLHTFHINVCQRKMKCTGPTPSA